MKTIQQIEKEIAEIKSPLMKNEMQFINEESEEIGTESKVAKKARKRLEFLKQAKNYLLTNPSETFVNEMKAKTKTIYEKYKSAENYKIWFDNLPQLRKNDNPTKLKSEYRKTMNLKSLETQLTALNYLLA